MMKINLNRKYSSGEKSSSGSLFGSIFGFFKSKKKAPKDSISSTSESQSSSSRKLSPSFLRMVLCGATVFLVQSQLDEMKTNEITKVDKILGKIEADVASIQKKLDEVKGFELIKKQLENDENSVNQKLAVIKELTHDHTKVVEVLRQLAQLVPEDVWFTSMVYRDHKYSLSGGAGTTSLVTDFLNSLQSTNEFGELIPSSITEYQKDSIRYQQFEISAISKGDQKR